ncbi:CAP domain-containing protein [Pallidibacillus pasinlerensis]|uniref:CAP domain-containing protein n=1 Tax=Pallidibacillus pasinlerensis TaxID=2703818 RepID=UPI0028A96742|nr:CAP-associated domain-containing protein [Pallidibacillus pasinlerensis]
MDTFQKEYGKPTRIDPSYYGYSWYIYNNDDRYMMVGVLNHSIVSIAVATANIDTSPFKIGENLESVYQKMTMQPEIELKIEEGVYRFELFEDDLNINPLIPLGDIFAQLYFDQFEGNLLFIRFMDEKTLVKHRPYDMTYRGKLIEAGPMTDEEWSLADSATEKQIFELTNIIRNEFSLEELTWDEAVREVAFNHSVDMFETETFSHESEKFGQLADRLARGNIFFESAGENIAYQYTDSIAVVSGWLNSKGHRDTLLNENFTHIGVGVYKKYYTQIFLEKSWE